MAARAASNSAAYRQQAYAGNRNGKRDEKDAGGEAGREVCVANIGPRERRQRLVFGLQAMGVGLVMAVTLITLHVDIWWRLVVFLPFSAGASGYLQARDKT